MSQTPYSVQQVSTPAYAIDLPIFKVRMLVPSTLMTRRIVKIWLRRHAACKLD